MLLLLHALGSILYFPLYFPHQQPPKLGALSLKNKLDAYIYIKDFGGKLLLTIPVLNRSDQSQL